MLNKEPKVTLQIKTVQDLGKIFWAALEGPGRGPSNFVIFLEIPHTKVFNTDLSQK